MNQNTLWYKIVVISDLDFSGTLCIDTQWLKKKQNKLLKKRGKFKLKEKQANSWKERNKQLIKSKQIADEWKIVAYK